MAGNLTEHLWGQVLPRHVDGLCSMYSAKPMRGAMPAWRVRPEMGSGADSDASNFGVAETRTHLELLQRCIAHLSHHLG